MAQIGGLRINGLLKMSSLERPLVSIITIVLNGETTLEVTINSVLNQTYTNIEYIIIDGGSTDRTIEIIEKYSSKIDYWISEPDEGISDAFNKGIRQAKGELIGIINSGDYYSDDAVKSIVKTYNLRRNDIIYGDVMHFSENGDILVETTHSLLRSAMGISHCAVFISKNCYNTMGGYDTSYKLAMDNELLLRFFVLGATFEKCNFPIAHFNLNGVSQKNKLLARKECLRAKNKYTPDKLTKMANYFTFMLEVIQRLITILRK